MHSPAVQSGTLLTLVAALVDAPGNTRTFEALDGLLAITSLFRSRATSRDVKLKLVEFLYFYLMPEAPLLPAVVDEEGRSVGTQASGEVRGPDGMVARTKTTEEKQAILGRHLSNVDDLVRDLATSAPFGVGL